METNDYIKSITKKYHDEIWGKFVRCVHENKLIDDGDKIAVCVSGGKDSFCLALCMKELQRQSLLAKRQKFEIVFLCMNPGYTAETTRAIKQNAKLLNIPLTFFKSNIFNVVKNAGGSPCYLCAKMRRGNLYAQAQRLGCNKIALAHHFDDVIETVMMNLLYQGRIQTMLPKLKSRNFADMQLIRPFCLVREADIIKWKIYNGLEFINCACPLTENQCSVSGGKIGKRMEVKMLLAEIAETNEAAPQNIYTAMKKINLNAVLGYQKNGEHRTYLDDLGCPTPIFALDDFGCPTPVTTPPTGK
ncbi:MAG: tRNA 2-thiocytidine biosynthesis TtcA family protein [Christensenellaceae bacterium]|jgi:tRNA(Ile)-lysidine synthase TilS/MesJ|nr:tRNA 2-thiocytidine biosynthesis TtcA family protein [Christensenellaceae bacterium]